MLLALAEAERRVTPSGKKRYLVVQCDCGTVKSTSLLSLRNGKARSCGCNRNKAVAESLRRHGMAGSPTWNVWQGIRRRCADPANSGYHKYGGRGIRVCERWLNSFENFLADMGERPPGMTIDRIDNNGHYEPGNCRWASPKDQARNRRSNRIIAFRGESRPLAYWVEQSGLPYSLVHTRLRSGWPLEAALTTELHRNKQRLYVR